MSINVTRISFVRSIILRNAGNNAHKAPPINEKMAMAGNNQRDWVSENDNASPPAKTAPIINCPSAPIFQIFALKQSTSPVPMIMRGQAFTNKSAILSKRERGDIKKW